MMGEIKLGPVGREITLPTPRFRGSLNWPVTVERSVEEAQMSDGSFRVNFQRYDRQVWPLEWDLLTAEELEDFEWLRGLRESLHYQNTWDSEAWYTVYIAEYERQPLVDLETEGLYRVRMTLKELG